MKGVSEGFNFGCGCILCLVAVVALCVFIPTCAVMEVGSQIDKAKSASPAPSPAVPPSVSNPDLTYHGTADANFGKDWVVVDGTRLTGITMVNASPGAQVALVYFGGGKNVPVSKLPQGFLDEWKITPDLLKKEDGQ